MRKRTVPSVSPQDLHRFFVYDPDTGELRWRIDRSTNVKAGDLAGAENGYGYRIVNLKGCRMLSHRIIRAMMTGEWPPDEIDHRNRITRDDRWCNLRDADRSLNNHNRAAYGVSKVKYVYPHRGGGWQVQKQAKGVYSYRKYFVNFDDAVAAAARL